MTTTDSPPPPALAPGTVPALVRWTCLLCGRDKFSRPGQPHLCGGVFRKRFKAEAARRGLANAWVQTLNAALRRGEPGASNGAVGGSHDA